LGYPLFLTPFITADKTLSLAVIDITIAQALIGSLSALIGIHILGGLGGPAHSESDGVRNAAPSAAIFPK
jgi:hypothetical protein